jgi:hypothetical protein
VSRSRDDLNAGRCEMQVVSRPRVLQMAWTTKTSTPVADLLLASDAKDHDLPRRCVGRWG